MLLPKLFSLVAQFCTKALKAFWSKLIALLRYLFDNLFKLIIRLITIFLIVIFIVHIIGRSDDKIVSLEPITVPIEYIKCGISEQSLTNLLIDKLKFIDMNVSTRRSGNTFKSVSKENENEIIFKYQKTSIPLNLLYSFFLRYVLGIEHKVINGSVIKVGEEIWVVIRIIGEPGESFRLPIEKFKNIEDKCTEIAEYCYKQIDPYRMALYYFQKHRDIVKNSKKTMFVEDIEKLLAFYEDLEKSKNLTDVIIEKSPEDFWALNLKGLIFLELANLADHQDLNNKNFITQCHNYAHKSFESSIRMAKEAKKSFLPAYTCWGHLYYEQEDFIESFSKYNEAIEEGEDDVKAYLGKANSFLLLFWKDKKIQDKFLIKKNFFFDKSVKEVINDPIQTQKYAIVFYNDAIEQFGNVGRERSNVKKSLDELDEIVKILKKDEKIDNKKKIKGIN